MCRLYGFISNEPTKVDCSLVFAQNALMQQSRVDHVGLDHTDGWGIAAYHDGQPEVYRKTTAAYKDGHFSTTAESIYSTAIVAHVRRATVGKGSIDNTHPFVSGQWTFAHNGTLTGFDKFRSQLEQETHSQWQSQRTGETDSEQYFLWLMSRMEENGLDNDLREAEASESVTALIRNYVGDLATLCEKAAPDESPRLNFVLTDGLTMLACRWNNSLFMIRREGIYECEICGIPHIHHHETVNHKAIAIASEPVTHEIWEEVANHSVVLANVAKTVSSQG